MHELGLKWVIEGKIAGMPMPPMTAEVCQAMRAAGIRALVNLTDFEWPRGVLDEAGIAYQHIHVIDFEPPTMDQVEEFVEFCATQIDRGNPVAVHCHAGRGRTGTMIACYLVSIGWDSEEAIDEVRERIHPGAVETDEQELAVAEYEMRRQLGITGNTGF